MTQHRGPHISISNERLLPRVLGVELDEAAGWPAGVRELAAELAGEMFLPRYNPFIDADAVKRSIARRLEEAAPSLSTEYAELLQERVEAYWRELDDLVRFRREVGERLAKVLPATSIVSGRSLIETATDATDLRMELPLLMVSPETAAQVREVVALARELGFSLIPRGGGTGLTGGAIPALARSVVLSMSKLKTIGPVDTENRLLTAQAGVLTLDAIRAAAEAGLLFTVDPASKAASSIGGNVAENSGGPFAFEYGVTLDAIHSFSMVTPRAELIEVRRRNHPRHKIMPGEEAVFDILDESGELLRTVVLSGDEIRGKDLGKDVSNKFLGGLPGVQKEGVDGIVTDATFILHDKPALSRTLCLEFYGRSMQNAMYVIKDIVAFRDRIREKGDLVKISALEEFGPKYVQAIGYAKKSDQYEGEPISVLLVQLDSDHEEALAEAVGAIVDMAAGYDRVDIFAARDEREAEIFWEDRHKLSAIAKRTSGFKINEDVVIPIDVIPEFSDFLENLNLHYLARAYRRALKKVTDLPAIPPEDELIDQEFDYVKSIFRGDVTAHEQNDQELEVQIAYFFTHLQNTWPESAEALGAIHDELSATRVVAANHMHAGDGNCHVNFPVNSNDAFMLGEVHEAVDKVFKKVMELGGAVSGEHGIGITKIGYLEEAKIEALRQYKREVDPDGVLNPGKLTGRALSVEPYTFSFNRLIQDLNKTALPDKERLTRLLSGIQTCTRCGKCKQACPMYFPEQDLLFHPRNKNIALGALIEAVYYSLLATGEPDRKLLAELRKLMEHCTACGKCFGVCPVKIDSSRVALDLRAFLEDKRAGGHPVKNAVLGYLARRPHKRLPQAAKALSISAGLANRALGLVPARWRRRLANPALSGPGPSVDFTNLAQRIDLESAFILAPESVEGGRDVPESVFYFPGCGAGLFATSISMAAVYLLLKQEISVVLPDRHLCCGYPLLAQGLENAYQDNFGRNVAALRRVLDKARRKGFNIQTVLTSCGTCRESLEHFGVTAAFSTHAEVKDVTQFLFERITPPGATGETELLYHASCHAEWSGLPRAKAAETYRAALSGLTGRAVRLSPGCCGESGLGALTSPEIYNKLRSRKKVQLARDFAAVAVGAPVVVGCPSCRVGIGRSLMDMGSRREVLHSLEYLARSAGGPGWKDDLARAVGRAAPQDRVRFVEDLD